MSTKIHNGFKFKGNLTQAHHAFMELRAELKPIVHRGYSKLFANHICNVYDRYSVGLEDDKPGYVMSDFYSYVDERIKDVKSGKGRDPDIDFSFDITLHPVNRNKLLGIYYTEKPEFVEILKNKDYFKDYAYWNNTDRPDELTSRQWRQREKDWDIAIGSGIPEMNGFTVRLVEDQTPFISRSNMEEHIPDMNVRALKMAKELMRKEQNPDLNLPLGDVWAKEREFMKYLKSEEGILEAEKLATMLKFKLLPTDELLG